MSRKENVALLDRETRARLARELYDAGFDEPVEGRMDPNEWMESEIRKMVKPDGTFDLQRGVNVVNYLGRLEAGANVRLKNAVDSLPEEKRSLLIWDEKKWDDFTALYRWSLSAQNEEESK